mmetsp:Transcript_1578/g.5046  ORF Transcript_1578/g.5046 Transcript_1578/m.5046 type:complete len:467 (-) Transcript_1578:481-1881(-)
MGVDLDDHVSLRDVDGRVPDGGEEDGARRVVVLELGEHLVALVLRGVPVDHEAVEPLCVRLEREDVVREDDDLVPALLVVPHEDLAVAHLVGIHRVEQQPLGHGGLAEVLAVKLSGHGAPHVLALDRGDGALLLEVEPVGLVQLGADEEVEVVDLVVLAHEGRREPELGVGPHEVPHAAEGLGRGHVHLVQEEEAPVAAADGAHHGARLAAAAAFPRVEGEHVEGGDEHAALPHAPRGVGRLAVLPEVEVAVAAPVDEALRALVPGDVQALAVGRGPRVRVVHPEVLALRGEGLHGLGVDVRPADELTPPLLDGHARRAEHEARLLDRVGGRDAHQGLSRPAGEHDDPRARPAVAEHALQGLLLVVAQALRAAEAHRELRALGVHAVRVLLEHGHAQVQAALLDGVHAVWPDLDGAARGGEVVLGAKAVVARDAREVVEEEEVIGVLARLGLGGLRRGGGARVLGH